jgi:hypothetical protein
MGLFTTIFTRCSTWPDIFWYCSCYYLKYGTFVELFVGNFDQFFDPSPLSNCWRRLWVAPIQYSVMNKLPVTEWHARDIEYKTVKFNETPESICPHCVLQFALGKDNVGRFPFQRCWQAHYKFPKGANPRLYLPLRLQLD